MSDLQRETRDRPFTTGVDTHYCRFSERRHFGSLDGLRCISILAVIWSHGPGQRATSVLLTSGRLGVDLFFAISGFLITTLLLRERRSTASISLRRFYARRALRIFPLYYTVLAIYIAAELVHRGRASGHQTFFGNLPYFLTYTSNWFVSATAVFGHAWSLATEEQFYCGWPWIEKYFPKVAPLWVSALIVMALLVGHNVVAVDGFPRIVVLSVAVPICFGVLVAHLLHERWGFSAAFRWFGFRGAPVAAFAATAVLISLRADRALVDLSFAIVVATCVIREDHFLRRLLSIPLVVRVGAVSYGMYLIHGLVYNVVDRAGSAVGMSRYGIPMFIIALALTLLLANFSYQRYESIFLRMKRRFEVPSGSAGQQIPEKALAADFRG